MSHPRPAPPKKMSFKDEFSITEIKNFCVAKFIVKKMKRNHILSIAYLTNDLSSVNVKTYNKTIILYRKPKYLNRHFAIYEWQRKNIKRCSTSVVIREIQIKITMHYTH
jgi:hypothetical protein